MDASERLGVTIALQQEIDQDNVRGAELLTSAFAAALKSSRRVSVCRPFPAHIPSSQDHQTIVRAVDTLPGLPTSEAELDSTTDLQLQLLQWLFLQLGFKRGYSLNLITAAQLAEELHAAGCWLSDIPQLSKCRCILRIDNHSPASPHNITIHGPKVAAYHGTDFSNMHSILHNGLLAASGTRLQSTGAVFGSGVYLAADFSVAYAFCKAREGWAGSSIGKHLRCVLLCFVDKDVAVQGGGTGGAAAASSLPEKYILVPQPHGVVVRYLLVFSDDALLGHAAPGQQGKRTHAAAAVCMYVTVGYIVLMLLLAVWGSWSKSSTW